MDSSSRDNGLQRRDSNHTPQHCSLNEVARRSGYMGQESTQTIPHEYSPNHRLHSQMTQTSILHNPYHDPLRYHPRTSSHNMINEASILREIEKQKIREEIIASEIAHRRALEDEVRRELMIERELALRRGGNICLPFTSYPCEYPLMMSPLLGTGTQRRSMEGRAVILLDGSNASNVRRDNDGFAFLRGNEVSGSSEDMVVSNVVLEQEEGVFLQPKPDKPVVGSKRTSSATSRSDLKSEKKAKKDLSCAICQVTSTSKQALDEHLSGKKHKANEEALKNNKASRNYTIGLFTKKTSQKGSKFKAGSKETVKALTSPLQSNLGDEDVKNEAAEKPVKKVGHDEGGEGKGRKYKYWCEACKVGTFSETVMNDHKRGKKHLRQVPKMGLKRGNAVTENVDEH